MLIFDVGATILMDKHRTVTLSYQYSGYGCQEERPQFGHRHAEFVGHRFAQ